MEKMIYLDMDGTVANLYVGEWLADLRAYNPAPYRNAERLIEEEVLLDLLAKGFTLGIISWLSKCSTPEYDREVRKAKREWLKENYPNVEFAEIHIVKYGTPKHYVAKERGILVDDEEQNRRKWKGFAVDACKLEDFVNML